MSGILVGYARVSTDGPDLTAQRDALAAMGVSPGRIYVDHAATLTHVLTSRCEGSRSSFHRQ